MTTVAQSARSSAVILQQGYVAHLAEHFESYPMACLPIANKPLVGHQIKYFENNGLFDIYIVVYHAIFKKVEKYLREYFDADVRTSIYLVVVLEEETESANALKMISEKQKEQELIVKKPSYEKELYRNKGTKRQMDILNFNGENVVVLEGTSLPDVPLAKYITDHQLTGATLTQLVREFDFENKIKVASLNNSFDIYAYCDLPKKSKLATESVYESLKRIVVKSDSDTAQDVSIKARRSLLKR